jgi:hypothetical protein
MTINTAMLVGLGFLVAALFAVLIAPAYRRRTVRLTTAALKRSLPLTEAEMRADKDRLRADHAEFCPPEDRGKPPRRSYQ